ncbi:murein hydrolase activator EnvC family protein [Idiomarina seosinensis]|uniref:Peptidase M23 n=1 Tax=Idiomarina seosinensis TaxID=281739 RepID=A0A432ZDT9_9GAMM|nr:peptidoglycan DD-metalloendopeptidase family protein [Idiomarina seosinensis]RUO76050.1 peptidase M23 [Idiomarina seosinensis]
MTRGAFSLLLLVTGVVWVSITGLPTAYAQQASAADKAEKQAQLEAIQQKIASRLEALEQRQQRLTKTEQRLRELEQKTASLATDLRNTRQQQQQLEQRIDANKQRQQQLQAKQQQQLKWLQKQLVSAYTNGQHDFLKLLLNQQDPAKLERMLSYYQYFNQARVEQIEQIKELARELTALEQQLLRQDDQLNALREQQQRQRQLLTDQKHEQEQLIADLQRQQRSDQARLEDLEQSREQLEQVIATIEQALQADVRLVGLKPVKKQLTWPTDGRVKKIFGQSREGPLRWKGILIEGDNGQSVRAIADGRILFADWLRGFGLVTVIDHGEGYMSLYGHNQTLIKAVGEEVKMGEEIALMGQSGARSRASLYFEIRYQGTPQNPTQWIN